MLGPVVVPVVAGLAVLALLLGGASRASAQQDEEAVWPGSVCLHAETGRKGQCRQLPFCHSAVSELRRGGYPQACGFVGSNPIPIVCCPLEDSPPRSPLPLARPPTQAGPSKGPERPGGSAPKRPLDKVAAATPSPQTATKPPLAAAATTPAPPSPQPSEQAAANASATTAAPDCGYLGFKCDSGQCLGYGMQLRCDGTRDCSDGSDEGLAACSAPAHDMAVGDLLSVKLTVRKLDSTVFFLLCNATECSSLRVFAIPSGTMAYRSSTGCPWPGPGHIGCTNASVVPNYWKRVREGEHTFAAQYRAAEGGSPPRLTVWRQGEADAGLADEPAVGVVDAPLGATVLRVRPTFWNDDFLVRFEPGDASLVPSSATGQGTTANPLSPAIVTESSNKPRVCRTRGEFACAGLCIRAEWRCDGQVHCPDGSDESPAACGQACAEKDAFRCDSGQCVGGLEKCDGVRHCADGSDETPAACAKAPAYSLPPGELVSAAVRVEANQAYAGLFFCLGDADCSSLLVLSSAGGATAWWPRTGCRWPGWQCADTAAAPQDPQPLFAGNYTFVVERRPAQLAVWLLGQPGNVGLVDAPAGATDQSLTVRIRPIDWSGDFPVEFKRQTPGGEEEQASRCGRAPAAPIALTVNGAKAAPGAFPWHVALYLRNRNGGQPDFICGGSLVASNVVVTAAHCVYRDDELRPPDLFLVALGKTFSEWDHAEDSAVFRTKVARVVPLPLYQGARRNQADDLAVLVLADAAPDGAMPVCVSPNVTMAEGEFLQVVGWGAVGAALDELEAVAVRFHPFAACVRNLTLNPQQAAFITPDKFCAIREAGRERPQGLAPGDSGGGALVQRGGLWHLAGVVSVSLDGGNMFAFTDVPPSVSWIHQFVAAGSAR